MCESRFRQFPIAELILPRSVSRHGFCAIDLPRESSRDRDLFAIDPWQALSHGFPRDDRSFHSTRRQRISRLADLCRLCADSDRDRRPLYAHDPIGVELNQSLCALDSTAIDLCLSRFPWAKFRRHKAAVKMDTLLDRHRNTASFIHITD